VLTAKSTVNYRVTKAAIFSHLPLHLACVFTLKNTGFFILPLFRVKQFFSISFIIHAMKTQKPKMELRGLLAASGLDVGEAAAAACLPVTWVRDELCGYPRCSIDDLCRLRAILMDAIAARAIPATVPTGAGGTGGQA